jgi:hypothetical protein
MSHFKQIPVALLLLLLVLIGVIAAIAGVYLLQGLAVALIVGGVTAAATGLLVDVD